MGPQGHKPKVSGVAHGPPEQGHDGVWCSHFQGQDKVRLVRPPLRMDTLLLVSELSLADPGGGRKKLYKNDIIPLT